MVILVFYQSELTLLHQQISYEQAFQVIVAQCSKPSKYLADSRIGNPKLDVMKYLLFTIAKKLKTEEWILFLYLPQLYSFVQKSWMVLFPTVYLVFCIYFFDNISSQVLSLLKDFDFYVRYELTEFYKANTKLLLEHSATDFMAEINVVKAKKHTLHVHVFKHLDLILTTGDNPHFDTLVVIMRYGVEQQIEELNTYLDDVNKAKMFEMLVWSSSIWHKYLKYGYLEESVVVDERFPSLQELCAQVLQRGMPLLYVSVFLCFVKLVY